MLSGLFEFWGKSGHGMVLTQVSRAVLAHCPSLGASGERAGAHGPSHNILLVFPYTNINALVQY